MERFWQWRSGGSVQLFGTWGRSRCHSHLDFQVNGRRLSDNYRRKSRFGCRIPASDDAEGISSEWPDCFWANWDRNQSHPDGFRGNRKQPVLPLHGGFDGQNDGIYFWKKPACPETKIGNRSSPALIFNSKQAFSLGFVKFNSTGEAPC